MILTSRDNIQQYIKYLEKHPTSCREATNYTKTFIGNMLSVVQSMSMDQKAIPYFNFALIELFSVLPQEVRQVIIDALIAKYKGSVASRMIKIYKRNEKYMTEKEKIFYKNFILTHRPLMATGVFND